MAINYTSLLALIQPVDGTEVSVWGDDVNNGVSSILDVAVAGTQNITTDGNVTLTITQATSSGTNLSGTSAQYAILLLSGARTATRTITLPASSKTYTVLNSTTGGYAQTVGGLTIAVGEYCQIAYNTSTSSWVRTSTYGGSPTFGTVTANNFIATASITGATNQAPYSYGTLSFTDVNIFASMQSSVNNYNQFAIQNTSNGTAASAGYVAYNDGGTATTNFMTVGINSSGYSGTGSIGAAGYGYLLSASTDMVIGTIGSNAIHFTTASAAADAMTISSSNVVSIVKDASIHGLTVGLGNSAVFANTALGVNALGVNTTGNYGTAVGYGALSANTTGGANNAFGQGSLATNTTGAGNSAFGNNALGNNTSGGNNSTFGYSSLSANTTGSNNTSMGYQALASNTTASYNTALGYQSLYSNTTANGLTAVGYNALRSNTTGADNNAFGNGALYSNTTGVSNTALGGGIYGVTQGSLGANTTGSYNTAVGVAALVSSTTANTNNAFGYQAAYSNTTGTIDAFGYQAGYGNTTGTYNAAMGYKALTTNSTGNYNSAFGQGSLQNNTTASNNTAVGYQAGYSNTTSGNSTYIGYRSGYTATGARNVGIGADIPGFYSSSLYAATGNENIGVGPAAGSGITSGSTNIAIGSTAMSGATTTGSTNIAIGWGAAYALTSGSSNTFVGSGSNGFQYGAGSAMTSGSKNSIFGSFSGNQGGLDIRTSSNYIVLSDGDGNPKWWADNSGNFYANAFSSNNATFTVQNNTGNAYSSVLFLGCSGAGAGAVKSQGVLYCFAGNQGTNGVYLANGSATSWTSTSDERLKDIIEPIANAAQRLKAWRTVFGKFKTDPDGTRRTFFIAQDIKENTPEVVSATALPNDSTETEYLGVQYTETIPVVAAAVNEHTDLIAAQAATIAALQTTITQMQAALKSAGVAGF